MCLGHGSAELVNLLTNPAPASPFSSLGALTLLASSSLQEEGKAALSGLTMDKCMPILSAALSSSAIDAGLTLAWYIVNAGEKVEYENATWLLELLVPLAASPPNPTSRLLILKLIGAIVRSVNNAEDAVLLFKQVSTHAQRRSSTDDSCSSLRIHSSRSGHRP